MHKYVYQEIRTAQLHASIFLFYSYILHSNAYLKNHAQMFLPFCTITKECYPNVIDCFRLIFMHNTAYEKEQC